MIFEKGDRVIFDNHKREVVCSDKEVAIMGLVTPLVEEDGESINYDSLIAVPNDEEFEDTIEYQLIE